jgi:hypothetical protein
MVKLFAQHHLMVALELNLQLATFPELALYQLAMRKIRPAQWLVAWLMLRSCSKFYLEFLTWLQPQIQQSQFVSALLNHGYLVMLALMRYLKQQ